MSYSKRVDATQAAIVAALRQTGATIVDLSRCGQGVPDLLCGRVMPCPFCQAHYPQAILLEVKTARGKLNTAQEEFHANWRGPLAIVRTIDDALATVGIADGRGAVLAALAREAR
jgi:lambda repressor-like predicted transcriptional regulator